MSRVVGLGAGGHARSVLDALTGTTDITVVGLLDADPARHGSHVLGVPVLGDDSLLPRLYSEGVDQAFIGFGVAGLQHARARAYQALLAAGLAPLTIVHSTAWVSPHAHVAPGVTVLAQAVINAGARVEANAVINTAAVVEHDCHVGPHVHLATGAKLAGGVGVGAHSLVGINAAVRQGITLGEDCLVGGGAMVVADAPLGSRLVGVPARPSVNF